MWKVMLLEIHIFRSQLYRRTSLGKGFNFFKKILQGLETAGNRYS
jgi:hypothetical protein